jgi:hypothetical protein
VRLRTSWQTVGVSEKHDSGSCPIESEPRGGRLTDLFRGLRLTSERSRHLGLPHTRSARSRW